eukprot:TRINITY_DN2017_c0_g1_i1.p1 TRINITY_DN2017_c0_g1~~TRINITY_DN2017_c0_g1_i1.p1  ORF type:complete len:831 (-),score=286.51 TRINITY_DN2017_c0_g1_i1:267-2759(-)
MAPKAAKRKAEETSADPSKKAKEEDDGEKEKNAPADSRAAIKSNVSFTNSADSTLNVVPAMDGKVLMALTEGGMQYMLAGARANVGMKAGRYMFEVKIIEALNPAEAAQGTVGRIPQPRQLVKLGFSTAKSHLLLGESDDHVFFDSEGFHYEGKTKEKKSQPFTRDQVLAVLLNLDQKSPNANTISLFREGQRISDPIPLPEKLKGKALFPHITFRNVTIQVNTGPTPFKSLPFACRMLQGAAAADVQESPAPSSKFEVVLPVCLPDEGTFDWLDSFIEKNPQYVELSGRQIQDWGSRSGLAKPKPGMAYSNDKPTFAYGLAGMDDMSVQRVQRTISASVPRNYVVMEVASNLVAEERAATLKRFNHPKYKKVALVVMGKPSDEFKQKVQARLLAEKQEKSDMEWRVKKAEKERQKQVKQRQKEILKLQKEAEARRKKMVEDFKKKQEEEAAKKKAEAGETKEEKEEDKMEVDTKKEEEEKPEVKEEEMKVEEEEEEEEEVDDLGDEPPKVELTDEEKQVCFRPKSLQGGDVAPAVLAKAFADFTLPEKSEGFDEIRFEWADEAGSKEHLRKFVLTNKQTSRIEDLQPSQTFKDKNTAWQKQFSEWQAKQTKFKATPPKKEEKKEGEETTDKPANLDIFTVEDVCDIGTGEPLFANFGPEDWALLQLRSELHLLQSGFKADVNDPDREHIPEQHLAFYYGRYFQPKQLNPKMFGFDSNSDLLDLIKDTVTLGGEPIVLTSQLAEDVDTADIFVKFTEESRRERKRRVDAGDETARLKFVAPVQPAPAAPGGPRPPGAQNKPQMGQFGKGGMAAGGFAGKGAMGAWGKGKW